MVNLHATAIPRDVYTYIPLRQYIFMTFFLFQFG